jgi:hypothetical protein
MELPKKILLNLDLLLIITYSIIGIIILTIKINKNGKH